MSHPSLIVLGYSEAAMLLRRAPRQDVAAIISIHGRREFGVEANVAHRLGLLFDGVRGGGRLFSAAVCPGERGEGVGLRRRKRVPIRVDAYKLHPFRYSRFKN